MLIKLIVRVRHALMTYPQQSYDVSVHVYTYTKHVYNLNKFISKIGKNYDRSETVFLTYYSHGKFSSEKLSGGIRHLSSATILVT